MIFIGVAVGIGGALAAGRLLERAVQGVRSIEPLALTAMVVFLVAAGLFPVGYPRSKVDPIIALRYE